MSSIGKFYLDVWKKYEFGNGIGMVSNCLLWNGTVAIKSHAVTHLS